MSIYPPMNTKRQTGGGTDELLYKKLYMWEIYW